MISRSSIGLIFDRHEFAYYLIEIKSGNDPINNIDPTGNGIITIMLLLGLGTLAGGIAGGIISKRNGNSGWEVAKDVILWASIGLATVGAFIATISVIFGAANTIFNLSLTLYGVAVKQAFAIGSLAFDFTAMFVAPLYGIKMQAIEYEEPGQYTIPDIKKNDLQV